MPDISPDGRSLAYWSEGDIFVSRMDATGQSVQLTHDRAGNMHPRWSPDGSRIVFHSRSVRPYDLWTIGPDGSRLKKITDGPLVWDIPSWSPDGRQLACSVFSEDGSVGGSFIIAVDVPWKDQQLEALPPVSEDELFQVQAWSPNGDFLAGNSYQDGLPTAGILIYSLGSQTYQRMAEDHEVRSDLIWLDNQRLLFSSPIASGNRSLYLLDRTTKQVREVFSHPRSDIEWPAVSPDSRTIYFATTIREADIWLASLEK